MRNFKRVLVTTCVMLIGVFSISTTKKDDVKIPVVEKIGGIYYLEVDADNSYDRGFQQGAALKQEIIESIIDFDVWVAEHTPYKNSEGFAEAFNSQTTYLEDLKRSLPDMYSELKGMSEASNVDIGVLFLYNSFDEYLAFLMEKNSSTEQVAHCTTTGVFGRDDKANYVTHNNDLLVLLRNKVVVTKIIDKQKKVEILQSAFVGIFAQNGVNNKGVAVGCNIILDLDRNTSGIPVAFNIRKILETNSVNEAKNYLLNIDFRRIERGVVL